MKDEEILKAITEINYEIPETELHILEFHSNGASCIVRFLGDIIWSSEDDDRSFDEDKNEYEPFEPFIKRRCNSVIDKLQTMKFKNVN